MISKITPTIKNLIRLGVVSTFIAAIPLKSTTTKHLSHSLQNITIPFKTDIVDFLKYKQQNDPFKFMVDSLLESIAPKDITENWPKMPKPHLHMDISKTKYEGNPQFLETFLSGVLKGKSQAFYNAQEKYGINATFLIGIANQESGYGSSAVARRCNNIGGMRTSNGYIKYKSVEECIDSIASNLQRNYVRRGLTTPPQIGKKYCETEAWPKAIVSQMKKIHNASQCQVFRY